MSDYVHDDLLAEIFERLPGKSLLRFRCLSNWWCSRISSPDFIHKQTLRSLYAPQKVVIAHIHPNSGRNIFTLHSGDQWHMCHTYEGCFGITTFESPKLSIVGSCNGIMCLLDKSNNTISLWNPSNRRKLSIHDCPCLEKYKSGFGFDPTTGDYKIVSISLKYSLKNKPLVYSLERRTWREVDFPTIPISCVKSRGYFLNGTLHWLVTSDEKPYDWIVTLNLSTEVFGTIALEFHCLFSGLAIIKGSLGVTTWSKPCGLWVMKEYNNGASWCVVSDLGGDVEDIESVGQLTNGDVVFKRNNRYIEVYNPLEQRRYVLKKAKKYQGYIETYVDSLALFDIGSLHEA